MLALCDKDAQQVGGGEGWRIRCDYQDAQETLGTTSADFLSIVLDGVVFTGLLTLFCHR